MKSRENFFSNILSLPVVSQFELQMNYDIRDLIFEIRDLVAHIRKVQADIVIVK